jgi:hypothetical protein
VERIIDGSMPFFYEMLIRTNGGERIIESTYPTKCTSPQSNIENSAFNQSQADANDGQIPKLWQHVWTPVQV